MTRRLPIRRGYNSARLIFAYIALICALGASCGLSDPSDSAASLTSDASPSATFSELLEHIPNVSEIEDVYVIDFARVRELYHIALPETDHATAEYVQAFTFVRSVPGVDSRKWAWLLNKMHYIDPERQARDYLAFDARNADSSIVAETEMYPRVTEGYPRVFRVFEVVRGRYDPDATRRGLARCSEECEPFTRRPLSGRLRGRTIREEGCPKCEPFTLSIHKGVEFYSVGKEAVGLAYAGPLLDPEGRGGSVAVTESHVYRTLWDQDMREMLEAASGNGRSLADDRNIALAAAALDGLGAYVGSIRRNVESFSVRRFCSDMAESEQAECVRDEERKLGGLLDEYKVLGVGFGKDADGPFIGVSLIYGDEDSAKRNATVFENMLESGDILWREWFLRAEVKSEGRAVIARLSVSNPYGEAPWFIIYDYAWLFSYR